MSTRLTETETLRMTAEVNDATSGPWYQWKDGSGYYVSRSREIQVCKLSDTYAGEADSVFIARARTNIPRLLVEIELLRAEVKQLQAIHAESTGLRAEIWNMRRDLNELDREVALAIAGGYTPESIGIWIKAVERFRARGGEVIGWDKLLESLKK